MYVDMFYAFYGMVAYGALSSVGLKLAVAIPCFLYSPYLYNLFGLWVTSLPIMFNLTHISLLRQFVSLLLSLNLPRPGCCLTAAELDGSWLAPD